MAKDFKIIHTEVRELLNSREVQQACLDAAQDIGTLAESMGPRPYAVFEVDVQAGKERAQARVKPSNDFAWWNTLNDNALLKAASSS